MTKLIKSTTQRVDWCILMMPPRLFALNGHNGIGLATRSVLTILGFSLCLLETKTFSLENVVIGGSCAIVYRCRLVMKLDKFLCFFKKVTTFFNFEDMFRCYKHRQLQNIKKIIIKKCRNFLKDNDLLSAVSTFWFLCFMFLFAFLALTLHKTRQKHAFFGRITNQKQKIVQGHGRFNI